MSSKTILPNGTTRHMGRKRAVAPAPRLSFKSYLQGAGVALPTPPPSVDYSPAASAAISQMYLNDQLGDCVIAGMAHLVGLFTANAGQTPVVFTNAQLLALYSAIGGYVPGNPATDNGCNETDALNYWQNHGAPAGSHQIAGWLAVDPRNKTEVMQALWLFENLIFGVELPDAWLNVTGSGFTWDAGTPNPNNGHCFVGTGYDSTGVKVSTWGMLGTLTWQALTVDVGPQAGGELYVVLSQDMINRATAKAPNGFNWGALASDFAAIGGHLPVPVTPPPAPPPPAPAPPAPAPPAPAPPAPPAPAPKAPPTQSQVLSAVTTAISNLYK